MDVARGGALLGIFLVNIQLFAEPFGTYMELTPPGDDSAADRVLFYLVKVFCEGKFYTLFSLLFGMGMALQFQRAASAGRGIWGPGLRRQGALLLVGLAHALLVWYGDVLFLYAFAGTALLLIIRGSAKVLAWVAAALLAFSLLLGTGVGALQSYALKTLEDGRQDSPAGSASVDGAPAIQDAPAGAAQPPAAFRLFEGARAGQPMDPAGARWRTLETEAYRSPQWMEGFYFRVLSWAMIQVFTLLGFGWHVVAMFCLGAALVKWGVFEPSRRAWPLRFIAGSLLIGLPVAALGAALPSLAGTYAAITLTAALVMASGPFVALGWLGLAMAASRRFPRALPVRALASVGRMAFTNYLLQSLVATFVFYGWGLGYFGGTSRAERVAFVAAVYAGQVVVSVLWLRLFSMGPAEWCWRAVTYLRLPEFRRRPGSPGEAGPTPA